MTTHDDQRPQRRDGLAEGVPTLRGRLLGHEAGTTDSPAPEPTMWCSWGTEAINVIDVLCRTAERIDIFAPLGIHPALGRLDPDRCTAYVLEGTAVGRTDVSVRFIPHSVYPGAENPLTRFTMPDGPSVVFYAYLHGAQFTEEPLHLTSAYALFELLPEITTAA
ncbi:hypothetical protein [Saccharothrix deserti]|uniref:hypothetical protein n=1 Tax=Saccharothrix deserti TaxID=2593674 RepID=UPI00131CEFF8|nr:hypothetical protein [Saccharothrix deserti]